MYVSKSFVLKPADADKKWYVVDGKDKIVGRLATEIASVLFLRKVQYQISFIENTSNSKTVIYITIGPTTAKPALIKVKETEQIKTFLHAKHIQIFCIFTGKLTSCVHNFTFL